MFGVSRTSAGIKERKHTMSLQNIIRAWKDADYRASLSEDERALLPEHPAGFIELDDTDLDLAAGGGNHIYPNPRSCGASINMPPLFVRGGRHDYRTGL
jgi:mersacidin/lichenicidin family type 2 lantibiotic